MKATWIDLAGVATLTVALGLVSPAAATAQTARVRYSNAQAREATARAVVAKTAPSAAAAIRRRTLNDGRAVIAAYEALVGRYPVSGYSDNALFNAASLADALYVKFGDRKDRDAARRLYRRVAAEYPTSSLKRQSTTALARLDKPAALPAVAVPLPAIAAVAVSPLTTSPVSAAVTGDRARLLGIERAVLPEGVRITLALDREVAYREESLAGPSRVFFDLKGVDAAPELIDSVLRYPTAVVRQIRVGRHPDSTVRVVLDLEGVRRHSVYPLYNPFRLVIDAEPMSAVAAASPGVVPMAPLPAPVKSPMPVPPPPMAAPPVPAKAAVVSAATPPPPVPTTEGSAVAVMPERAAAPEPPNSNSAGGFSIARQLGLGVSRIVIDPGHGGRDPGAQVKDLDEAALTLDIALRVEKLLQNEPGLEVVLTRRSNVYIPLEERTAIANREGADLFLSIHANASRNEAARGVETYFLSFASSPEAEAVAARENSANDGEMHNLPDLVKAITLNNKLDESRDLAAMVQEALVTRLRRSNKNVRNLGVKKAPFVVLIGAGMPSVLAEVSFVTNKEELQLLKTASYKQRIADALHAAVMRYRRSLKGQGAVAEH